MFFVFSSFIVHRVNFILCCFHFQAEELMRKIEKEEEQVAYDDPEKKIFHLCIVNLVIG